MWWLSLFTDSKGKIGELGEKSLIAYNARSEIEPGSKQREMGTLTQYCAIPDSS